MSSIISFDSPWVLAGLTVFIPLILYDFLTVRTRHIHKNLPQHLRIRLSASKISFRIFLACIIIALSGPRWGNGQTEHEYHLGQRSMADIVIALDVSRSMDIPDIPGSISRRDRGMAIVKDTVEAMPGTRFAVAVSRNRGIVAVPLTWDTDALLSFLDAAGSSLSGRGTNLESLVDAAADAFQSSYPSIKVILLVSDGEAMSGILKAAIDRCKREGITVNTIAVGSDTGIPFPGEDEIISKRDSGVMRMAAGQTGGVYIDGNLEDASRTLIRHLRSLSMGSEIRESVQEHQSRWFIFVIMAILSFGASKLCLLKIRE